MPPFELARRLRAGDTVFSAWCNLGSPIVAETIAREGFACTVLEQQHGLWDTASIVAGIGGVRLAGSTPAVRVPSPTSALRRARSTWAPKPSSRR